MSGYWFFLILTISLYYIRTTVSQWEHAKKWFWNKRHSEFVRILQINNSSHKDSSLDILDLSYDGANYVTDVSCSIMHYSKSCWTWISIVFVKRYRRKGEKEKSLLRLPVFITRYSFEPWSIFERILSFSILYSHERFE